MLRQHDPIETILNFVVAEIGRRADYSLETTLPLCLYFPTIEEREAFAKAIFDLNPNWVTRSV